MDETAPPHARPEGSKSAGHRTAEATPHGGSDTHGAQGTPAAGGLEFRHKARFVWKVALLLITFVALIPILLYQDVLGAKVYLWFLIGVHLVGLVVFGWGVTRHDIAPSTYGFVMRLVGLVAVAALLYLASKGLGNAFGSALFWGSLFALWAIHTGGLLLLHVRGKSEKTCPFA